MFTTRPTRMNTIRKIENPRLLAKLADGFVLFERSNGGPYMVVTLTDGWDIYVYEDSQPMAKICIWSTTPHHGGLWSTGDLRVLSYSIEGEKGTFSHIYRPPLPDFEEDRSRVKTAITFLQTYKEESNPAKLQTEAPVNTHKFDKK
jgi:hypothetical protein